MSSVSNPAVSVIVMAYNEVDTLERTCQEIIDVLNSTGVTAEVVVINDGSTDGTGDRADAFCACDARVRVIHHSPNRGLGGVYRTGFAEARGEFVTFFPADGQFPARIIAEFLPRMSEQDMVLGFLPAGTRPIAAETLSVVERVLYRLLLGKIPRFQGILMFKRELLSLHQLRSTGRGWAVLMELVVRCSRAKHRIISVPTEVRPRTHGASKVNNMRTIWSNFRQLLALRSLLGSRAASTRSGIEVGSS